MEQNIKLYFRGRGGRKVFPIGESGSIHNRPEEVGETHDTAQCLTAKGIANWTGSFIKQPISMTQKKYKEVDIANTLTAAGPSSGRGNYSPVNGVKIIPVLTPDRAEKRQNGRRFKEDGEPMFTLTAQDRHGVMIKEATKQGFAIAEEGDSINLEQPNSKTRRGRVGKGVAQTLTTSSQQATLQGCRIRRLTPRECFRLQGVSDEYFNRAAAVNSDSQLYKQAGNMVTVNVIYEIAKRLGE